LVYLYFRPSSEELGTLDHCHTYSCDASVRRQKTVAKARKKLLIAVVLTIFFVIGEVVGGYLSQSLAIMTDAAHMLSGKKFKPFNSI
jgi:zinc transporter 2